MAQRVIHLLYNERNWLIRRQTANYPDSKHVVCDLKISMNSYETRDKSGSGIYQFV